MHDLLLALVWLLVATAGLGLAVALRGRGVAAARVRDVLHLGAGVWVFGWPAWEGAGAAVAIPWVAVAVLAALPVLGVGWPLARRAVAAVTSEDERWAGLVLYALGFAVFTTLALGTPLAPGPPAVALLALAWGDGLGGAVGSRLGRRTYHLPWSKPKTWLGSAVVAVGTAAGVLAWSAWTAWSGWPARGAGAVGAAAAAPAAGIENLAAAPAVGGAGLVAAVAEALAPRGTDNLVVPAAVFAWLVAVG